MPAGRAPLLSENVRGPLPVAWTTSVKAVASVVVISEGVVIDGWCSAVPPSPPLPPSPWPAAPPSGSAGPLPSPPSPAAPPSGGSAGVPPAPASAASGVPPIPAAPALALPPSPAPLPIALILRPSEEQAPVTVTVTPSSKTKSRQFISRTYQTRRTNDWSLIHRLLHELHLGSSTGPPGVRLLQFASQ